MEARLRKADGGYRWLLFRSVPLFDDMGRVVKRYGVGTDIDDRKRAEQALAEEHARLQQALEEVKTLQGIVPICASCKKIRDDQGYWNSLEAYLARHTDATFTHGICPDCAQAFLREARSGRKPGSEDPPAS